MLGMGSGLSQGMGSQDYNADFMPSGLMLSQDDPPLSGRTASGVGSRFTASHQVSSSTLLQGYIVFTQEGEKRRGFSIFAVICSIF